MSLGWLAAVLRPNDVVPPFQSIEDVAYAQLAELVAGLSWRTDLRSRERESSGAQTSVDPMVELASKAFRSDTIQHAVNELRGLLTNPETSLPVGQRAALTLIACCAASELDDFETCELVLAHGIRIFASSSSADAQLATAALLQQRCLRRRDVGLQSESDTDEVLEQLDRLDLSACEPFEIRAGAHGDFLSTLESISASLRSSAESLRPRIPGSTSIVTDAPDRELQRTRSHSLEEVVRRSFVAFSTGAAESPSVAAPDPFYYALQWELLGHRMAYTGRLEQAWVRLISLRTSGQTEQVLDMLRLLRHSGSKRDLDLALRYVRSNGPLDALARDARQIVTHRKGTHSLRVPELRVLRAGADLLSPDERLLAFSVVGAVIDAGGPIDLPDQYELDILRLEEAWRAQAALASSSAEAASVSARMRHEASTLDLNDQLVDQAIAGTIATLESSRLGPSEREAWNLWLESPAADLGPSTARTVSRLLGKSFHRGGTPSVRTVAGKVDSLILGLTSGEGISIGPDDIRVIADALAESQKQAARGVHSFGGTPAADVAAALILKAEELTLWPNLTRFLVDESVAREHKRAALDRIAGSDALLPESAVGAFQAAANRLLQETADPFTGPAIVPFPAALRMLAAKGFISEGRTVSALSDLISQSGVEARREAARTLALLLTKRPSPWLLGLALHLSYDDDAHVTGYAGLGLANAIDTPGSWSEIATNRIQAILNSDGLTGPDAILSLLEGEGAPTNPEIRATLESIAAKHISSGIRRRARHALKSTT